MTNNIEELKKEIKRLNRENDELWTQAPEGFMWYSDSEKEDESFYHQVEENRKKIKEIKSMIDKLEKEAQSSLTIDIKKFKCLTDLDNNVSPENANTIQFGKYPQNDKNGKIVDNIEWFILKKEEDKALLLSKNVLDCKQYDTNGDAKCWANSSIRAWLNDVFYKNAFSDEERKLIIESTNNNKTAMDYNVFEDEPETKDKVFFPSIIELQTLFKSDLNDDFLRLCAKPTKYALNCEISVESHPYLNKWCDGTSWYWIRNTVVDGNAAVVNGNGCLGYTFGLPQDDITVGIRPAMWIKI